jgi:hypothetical protein
MIHGELPGGVRPNALQDVQTSRMLKKPASVRKPLFGLFGLSRLFG